MTIWRRVAKEDERQIHNGSEGQQKEAKRESNTYAQAMEQFRRWDKEFRKHAEEIWKEMHRGPEPLPKKEKSHGKENKRYR